MGSCFTARWGRGKEIREIHFIVSGKGEGLEGKGSYLASGGGKWERLREPLRCFAAGRLSPDVAQMLKTFWTVIMDGMDGNN